MGKYNIPIKILQCYNVAVAPPGKTVTDKPKIDLTVFSGSTINIQLHRLHYI